MAAAPFTVERTDDSFLDRLQRRLKSTLDQIENTRRGLMAFPAQQQAEDYQIADDTFVVYVGPGGHTFTLPPANAVTGDGRVVFILNSGGGSITVRASGDDKIGAASLVALGVNNGAVMVADAIASWKNAGGQDPLTLSGLTISGDSLTPDRRVLDVVIAGFRLFAVRTGGGGADVSKIEISNCLLGIEGTGERVALANDGKIAFGTSNTVMVGNTGGGGLQIGDTNAAKIGVMGATPISQQPAITAPAGGVVIDVQARAAIQALLNLVSAAAGGLGFTA